MRMTMRMTNDNDIDNLILILILIFIFIVFIFVFICFFYDYDYDYFNHYNKYFSFYQLDQTDSLFFLLDVYSYVENEFCMQFFKYEQ